MPIGRYRICGGESHAGDERLERVTAPPTATTGSPSEFAVAKPVTRFEQPGPDVTNVTPALPVMRPIPPAMNAAFCLCRQTVRDLTICRNHCRMSLICNTGAVSARTLRQRAAFSIRD